MLKVGEGASSSSSRSPRAAITSCKPLLCDCLAAHGQCMRSCQQLRIHVRGAVPGGVPQAAGVRAGASLIVGFALLCC